MKVWSIIMSFFVICSDIIVYFNFSKTNTPDIPQILTFSLVLNEVTRNFIILGAAELGKKHHWAPLQSIGPQKDLYRILTMAPSVLIWCNTTVWLPIFFYHNISFGIFIAPDYFHLNLFCVFNDISKCIKMT